MRRIKVAKVFVLSIFHSSFGTNGHQNGAFSCLKGGLKHPRIVNGYRADYAFIEHRPSFRGMRLGLKKHPLYKDKEATFWHITSEGSDEEERLPDMRRLERIKWPAVMINNSEHPYLKVWENTRGTKTNILIFHEAENYLVVLRKGNGYVIPWTAYLIEYESRKRKLLKEYEAYIKSKER